MKKTIVFAVIFAIIGLIAGYLIFGRIAGEYVKISTLFSSSGGELGSIGRKIIGIETIRQNILISGGIGAVIGIVVGLVLKKK